jgi:hypothetical protein
VSLLGVENQEAVFVNQTHAAVIDTEIGVLTEVGDLKSVLSSRVWEFVEAEVSESLKTLAEIALSQVEQDTLIASGSRLYTIPTNVQAEAKKALKWRKEHKRGGTPVGLNTARTLAKGGQIGIEKMRHIAKYFPRHEVDKKGKGWKPGEDNFPSNGRIAWALWGGDGAWRWSRAIVERENKKSKALKADSYVSPDLSDFKDSFTYDSEGIAPEFLARVRMDGTGIDRIYKVDMDGRVYIWDDGLWDDLGKVEQTAWAYDAELDDPEDLTEKTHVMIDPESAIEICARMQSNPFKNVLVSELDKEEYEIAVEAIEEEDWDFIDSVTSNFATIVAAPTAPMSDQQLAKSREKTAENQPRDALGQFAKVGARVAVGGDAQRGLGKITDIDGKTGLVKVALDDGRTVEVSSKYTQDAETVKPPASVTSTSTDTPLDVSGILGEPRDISGSTARLEGTIAPLTRESIQLMLNDYPAYVSEQRASYTPYTGRLEEYDRNYMRERYGMNASAESEKASPSDVPPIYLAIVAPDDLLAVIDLVSIVPAGKTSNQPMTYVRKEKQWQRDVSYLNELKSATPPKVVRLKKEQLNEVLVQVDSVVTASGADLALMVLWGPKPEVMELALIAAGGADRNRGNAENLRRYWVRGKGAAKIRWGTPGDWKRCVRYLGRYMGVRAKGYCQLRHKEATGVYTGSKLNPGRENSLNETFYTKITEQDLLKTVSEIMKETDSLFDFQWEPEAEIVEACKELGNCSKEEFESLVAAGGRRRKAKKLLRYWTIGKGGAKIRWNTGGDWTRCVRYIRKYLGPRAKGYCALRHKEMTGMWTGDKEHRRLYGRVGSTNNLSTMFLKSTEEIINSYKLKAIKKDAMEKMAIVASSLVKKDYLVPTPVEGVGSKFIIPLVIPEDTDSGDGRKFKKNAITFRDLPLPLMWQIKTGDGHSGSVVVGRIDYMERTERGIGNAYGFFDTSAYAREVERLIKNGFVKGVSADMDKFEATEEEEGEEAEINEAKSSKKTMGKERITINKARVMGITIVPKPAFQECMIFLDSEQQTTNPQEETVLEDGIYVDDVDELDASSLVACAFVAGAIPVTPPADWFENPKLSGPTPLTIDDDGRVYGHIAAWQTNHIGLPFGTKPPRSRTNYSYFHTGVIKTDAGISVPVGQLTLAGGHASLEASAQEAVKHYDDTASAFADVHAGEDQYGIWVSGGLRPGTTPEQIRAARASAPSGDWRPIRGSLELVAVCQVNVPGFPIARARVASGSVMALVAAGASTLAKMKSDPVTELNARLLRLETASLLVEKSEELQAIKEKFAEARSEFSTDYGDFAFISSSVRKKLAKSGKALPDGSFPIRNASDLKNAIKSYGRASKEKRALVKKHIIERARDLKKYDLIPEEWISKRSRVASNEEVNSIKARVASAQDRLGKALAVEAEEEVILPNGDVAPEGKIPTGPESGLRDPETGKYTPQTQPRDEAGKFRRVLARLKQNLGTAGLQKVLKEAKYLEQVHELGDYVESVHSGSKLLDIIGRLDSGALNKVSLENVRSSAAELGKVIANLPLGFNDQTEKVRYSDLPPALRELMDSMMERVEAKIGKEDADIANESLRGFKNGSDVYSQGEISEQMNKMLRLLT